MKKIITIFLLLTFAMQSFSQAFIVMDYYLFTKTFSKNCINKGKPKMHCNGKCQMMQKLKEEEKKEQENTERKLEFKSDILSSRSSFFELSQYFPSTISILYASSKNREAIKMPRSCFHPPSA